MYVPLETAGASRLEEGMVHGKHPLHKMNEEILLTNTKISKDHIQDIFNVDPTEHAPQGMSRDPQILCGEFLPLVDRAYTAVQRIRRLLEQFSLPLPADQAALARTKVILREGNQGVDQLRDSVAAAGRNSQIGAAPSLLPDRDR